MAYLQSSKEGISGQPRLVSWRCRKVSAHLLLIEVLQGEWYIVASFSLLRFSRLDLECPYCDVNGLILIFGGNLSIISPSPPLFWSVPHTSSTQRTTLVSFASFSWNSREAISFSSSALRSDNLCALAHHSS